MMPNPYHVVEEFERMIAEWAGSSYAVAVDSGTAAIFLSLKYINEGGRWNGLGVTIPAHTYPSVPCSIIHSGMKVKFINFAWMGEYELAPTNVWDSALRFKKGMYHGGFQCLSFHIKKHLPIGRGGMILMDDEDAYEWLKKARFDGRSQVPLLQDNFTMLGYNCYLEPSQAARGIQLFQAMLAKHPNGMDDLQAEDQGYPDLSKYPVYQQ